MHRLNHKRTIQLLIGVKSLLLVAVWLAYDGRFHLGDIAAVAKDDQMDEEKVGPSLEKGTSSQGTKSLLDDLFNLPKLDRDSLQKEELGTYLELAERKEKQVRERVDLLKKKEDQLKILERSIDDKLKRLDEERKFFAQTIQKEKDLKDERVGSLIAMYSKMEPKKAAPVMEKLDKDLVVELFKKLPQKQVTAILEVMNPDKSVQISEYFGRVRSAREYDILKEMNASLRKEFDDCKTPMTK